MAGDGDLINFDVIESQKENIQSLPGGRSARSLAELYSPRPAGVQSGGSLAPSLTSTPNPGETKTLHDTIRADFEAEVAEAVEADDPLDIYDRYVRWTLDAYPSAQATPQSQLHLLLERVTKAFVGTAQYRNDPRYLRLWLHYIRLFADAPRETFVYLARHNIGDSLALYYEEYAGWLEGAGCWAQADEVFRLGVERNARPQTRLMRKYQEFEQRRAVQAPESLDARSPASPALPAVRPALAAKIDPFAAAETAMHDPQAQQAQRPLQLQEGPRQASAQAARPAKPKMAIFSDAGASEQPALPAGGGSTRGWDSIGSIAERKKENTVAAKPWAGEKLSVEGTNKPVEKMAVFKDATPAKPDISIHPSQYQVQANAASRKKERVFVDLDAIYPKPEEPGTEQSFEEIWATIRGLLHIAWEEAEKAEEAQEVQEAEKAEEAEKAKEAEEEEFVELTELDVKREQLPLPGPATGQDPEPFMMTAHHDVVMLDENGAMIKTEMDVKAEPESPLPGPATGQDPEPIMMTAHHDVVMLDENGAMIKTEDRESRPRKKRFTEINETQIIKAKLDSPAKPKMKKKRGSTSEPTMTMHTRAATDDIYDIFNKPKEVIGIDDDADTATASEDDYETDGDYTSGGESIGTVRDAADVAEDAGEAGEVGEAEAEMNVPVDNEVNSVRAWSGFMAQMHTPGLARHPEHEESGPSQEYGQGYEEDDEPDEVFSPLPVYDGLPRMDGLSFMGGREEEEEEEKGKEKEKEAAQPSQTRTSFIPIPPEDYVAPTRPYRDPVEVANSRLPFMTPITERTESSLEFDSDDNKRALHAKTPSKAAGKSLPMPYPDEYDEDLDEYGEEEEDGVYDEDEEAEGHGVRAKGKGTASEPMSSPLIDIVDDGAAEPGPVETEKAPAQEAPAQEAVVSEGPIINALQCNPMNRSIRAQILAHIQPPLRSYEGFYVHQGEKSEQGSEIRRYAKAMSTKSKSRYKAKPKPTYTLPPQTAFCSSIVGSGGSDDDVPVVIEFSDCPSRYTVHRELGAGAFAPVFLVEKELADDEKNPAGGPDQGLRALKMETPSSAWEFYMMRLVHTRLGPKNRALHSLAPALECHLYRDETFLFMPFYGHGTLLDVVNMYRQEAIPIMEETLAMFFTIELFRTVEALHANGILHGDIKADNCLMRVDEFLPYLDPEDSLHEILRKRYHLVDGNEHLPGKWYADGSRGWAARGVVLIDFGRSIDMRAFPPDVQFKADWKTTPQDCPEIREGRPWTYEIDYHGLAGVLHCLLHGKYMVTVPCEPSADGVKRYRTREPLKRYWETEIWSEIFDLLLNPVDFLAAEEGGKLPALRSMRRMRERLEDYLEVYYRRGPGLKSQIVKIERWARARAMRKFA